MDATGNTRNANGGAAASTGVPSGSSRPNGKTPTGKGPTLSDADLIDILNADLDRLHLRLGDVRLGLTSEGVTYILLPLAVRYCVHPDCHLLMLAGKRDICDRHPVEAPPDTVPQAALAPDPSPA